jgi:hypothetical protein
VVGATRAQPASAWQTITWREGTAAPLSSRFVRLRVRPAHRDEKLTAPRLQLFVAAMIASLSEEVAAKDQEIASLREHVADRRPCGRTPVPAHRSG